MGRCKECQKANTKAARGRNPDHYQEYDRKRANKPERVAARKAYQQENKPLVNEIKKRWIERNPEKRKAHIAVGNAVRDGRLIKKPCVVCGEIKVEAHHFDYSKPLEVQWRCKKHHKVGKYQITWSVNTSTEHQLP